MAKLFKQSTFLFVFLGLLFLAKDHGTAANKHKEEIAAAAAAGAATGAASVLKGAGAGASVSGALSTGSGATGSGLKAGVGLGVSTSGALGTGLKAGVGVSASGSGAFDASLKEVSATIGSAAAAVGTGAGVDGAAGDGCACNDKVSEFLNKVLLILRYYTSKELGPELEALAVRFVEFFFSHLAAEKPEAMAKIHGFLQNSVQVTGAAVTKISKV